jgi:hypothetical protein
MKQIAITAVTVSFTLPVDGQPTNVSRTFTDFESAKRHIEANQRDWLLGELDKFVNHKRHIIEGGNHGNQLAALKVVDNAIADFHARQRSLRTICECLLRGFNWFEEILPVAKNPSHQGSRENLAEIKNFCETFLKQAA